MTEHARRVVLLIDYDNLQICASRDTPGRELQLAPVMQLAQRYGTVIMARAYAEWNLSTERLAVYKAGIEPAFAPVLRTESDRSGKSLADTVMVAEGMDMLWTLSPDVVVLATSDKDLIPLVRVAKQRGAFVVVLGSDFTAIPLREMADDHVTYRQLITDGTGRLIEAGTSRQPASLAEPVRRRSRERTGRERLPLPAAPATAGPAAATLAPARPDREPVAAPVVTSPPAASPVNVPASPAEPVAPVTAGLAGDADAQAGTRRRRRRGSRRRSERIGSSLDNGSFGDGPGGSNGYASDEAGDGGYDAEGEGESDDAETEISPTTSAADVALNSSGTVEDDEPAVASLFGTALGSSAEAPGAALPAAEVPSVSPFDAPLGSGFEAPRTSGFDEPRTAGFDGPRPSSADESRSPASEMAANGAGAADASVGGLPAAPVVRDRRRRTRRPAGSTDLAPATEATAAEPAATPDFAEPSPAPLADMLAGGEPSPSENGVSAEDSPAPARAPRPRRVASASRGRRTR